MRAVDSTDDRGMGGAPQGAGKGVRTILEAVTPSGGFDARQMARGEPGAPAKFEWRGRTYAVVKVLETWRETENYGGGAKDTYARRHLFRVLTDSGDVMCLAASRGPAGKGGRWVLRHIEIGSHDSA